MPIEKPELLRRVKEAVTGLEPEAEVILYGSRARGDARPDSDWDLLILLPNHVDRARTDRVRRRVYEVEWDTSEVLSLNIQTRQEFFGKPWTPFRDDVQREGLAL